MENVGVHNYFKNILFLHELVFGPKDFHAHFCVNCFCLVSISIVVSKPAWKTYSCHRKKPTLGYNEIEVRITNRVGGADIGESTLTHNNESFLNVTRFCPFERLFHLLTLPIFSMRLIN